MDSDSGVNESLRLQFQALQEQQQKRLQKLMERKKEKQREQLDPNSEVKKSEAFGIEDELKLLELNEGPSDEISKRLLEDENEQLQDQIRELRDENGRLYKLLKEKDFEIKHLRKEREEERLALAGTAGMAGDVAATKIVELSKRNRELTAEMESEKAKVKQLSNRVKQLEKETAILSSQSTISKDSGTKQFTPRMLEGTLPDNPEVKALQDKLNSANLRLTDCRNQIQTMKQELKMAHKVLASEIGEDVNVQQLLSSPGNWRGRAQQILAQQIRIRELENQLGLAVPKGRASEISIEEEMLGLAVPKRSPAQDKNMARIRTMEKERKETLEKLTSEYEALQKDQEDLKKKLEGSKARNKSLSSEVKTLKSQITTLIEKGKHDDELIDTLLKQQKQLQDVLTRFSQQGQKSKESQQYLEQQLNSESQKQGSLIGQLKQMVVEREAKVKELEEEIKQLTLKHHQHKQTAQYPAAAETTERPVVLGQIDALNTDAVRPSVSEGDLPGRTGSARMVSKLGHTLVESAATRPPSGSNTTTSGSSPDVKALLSQCTEYKALCQAAEVERDKLMELVTILQERVENTNNKALEAERKHQEERRRTVVLEQQLEKAKLDLGRNLTVNKPVGRNKSGQPLSSSRHSLNLSDKRDPSPTRFSGVPPESQVEELNTRLAIQLDENEALKSALKSALKAKEEDLRLYHEMMGQVKKVFLQAVRQHKEERKQNYLS